MRLLTIRVNRSRYGAENHMLRVACGAARRGAEVIAAFPESEGTASMVRDCEAAGVSHRPFEWQPLGQDHILARFLPSGRGGSFPSLWYMRNVLRSVRADVVQFTTGWPREVWVPSVACALEGVPMLAVFQSAPAEPGVPRWQQRALAWTRRRRQRWMAVSQQNLSVLESVFRTRRGEFGLLPNGIEITGTPTAAETEAMRQHVRGELRLPDGARILLTTARLDPDKGHADLLRIAPRVIDQWPDAVFVWAGDGGDRTALEGAVHQQGLEAHVRFLGYRTDIDRLLRASDLFVFPSHAEGGCSSSIREAMVHCVPIVCSDAGGIPEVLSDSIHCLMFPAKDTSRLLAQLSRALNQPQEMRALAQQARQRIEDFSSEQMLESYLAVFQELCEGASSLPRRTL